MESRYTFGKIKIKYLKTKGCNHTNILFINLKCTKLFDLAEYNISVLMYKVKNRLLPNIFQYSFIVLKTVCTTQGKGTNKLK